MWWAHCLCADVLPGQGVTYEVDADQRKAEDCPEGEALLSKQPKALAEVCVQSAACLKQEN